jgi:Cu/Ag efflux pump CusA
MEIKVREAVAQGARLRRRAVLWTAVTATLASTGATWFALEARNDGVALLGLLILSLAIVPAVWAYWAWKDADRRERRIVDVVARSAERLVTTEG